MLENDISACQSLRDALSPPIRYTRYSHLSLQTVLAAEGAGVGGVLRHLHLLHRLPERRTITRRVLASDSDFLSAFRHFEFSFRDV